MWDAIVVGSGVTGAGTARDCAQRGLRTLLVERGAPGEGTTAASTHLIHGGLRYLLYDRLTTHTTCWDSGHILRIAGPLLTRLPILWPVYRGHDHGLETVETLLESYDRFQRMKGGKPHLRLSAESTRRVVPTVADEGLRGAVSFDEWWVDPVALVKANLESAKRHGAEVRLNAGPARLFLKDGRVAGVALGNETIESRLVINAAGPWIAKVAETAGVSIPLRLQKGTHLVYRERLVPAGLLLEAAGGGRYVFVLPMPGGGTLVGPTDIASPPDPDQTATTQEEVRYLLDSVKRYFPHFPERYERTIVGARPILGQAGSEKLLSREFEVYDHETRDRIPGLLTIGGGKMSDFRAMAEAVTDAACRKLGNTAPCRTHLETLDGKPLSPLPPDPLPTAGLRQFLRHHPELRHLHALTYLGGAFVRHLARRPFQSAAADATTFKAYYA